MQPFSVHPPNYLAGSPPQTGRVPTPILVANAHEINLCGECSLASHKIDMMAPPKSSILPLTSEPPHPQRNGAACKICFSTHSGKQRSVTRKYFVADILCLWSFVVDCNRSGASARLGGSSYLCVALARQAFVVGVDLACM